jgi:hypothetical protein
MVPARPPVGTDPVACVADIEMLARRHRAHNDGLAAAGLGPVVVLDVVDLAWTWST